MNFVSYPDNRSFRDLMLTQLSDRRETMLVYDFLSRSIAIAYEHRQVSLIVVSMKSCSQSIWKQIGE
jgi:hypothetical protein